MSIDPSIPQDTAASKSLLTLAAQASTAAAHLLAGNKTHDEYVLGLADKYLHLGRELIEATYINDPYLLHIESAVWGTLRWCYGRVYSFDLTPEQDQEYQDLNRAWNALLTAWDAAHSAEGDA